MPTPNASAPSTAPTTATGVDVRSVTPPIIPPTTAAIPRRPTNRPTSIRPTCPAIRRTLLAGRVATLDDDLTETPGRDRGTPIGRSGRCTRRESLPDFLRSLESRPRARGHEGARRTLTVRRALPASRRPLRRRQGRAVDLGASQGIRKRAGVVVLVDAIDVLVDGTVVVVDSVVVVGAVVGVVVGGSPAS